MNPIFNSGDQRKAEAIIKSPYRLSDLTHSEIKDLAVVWCYYSGKIEGNTYTYVETEALLKDDITSEKRYEDAKMLKNLYNAFISELEYIHEGKHRENIDEKTLFRIHKILTSELVSQEESGQLRTRAVRITGTGYIPPKDIYEIKSVLNNILQEQEKFENPLEQAIFLHCNIAKIQPFIDGNKRTARMLESIVMMNNGLIPVYSAAEKDILHYRKGLISFYETGDYSLYKDYFLSRQIDRILSLMPEKEKHIFNVSLENKGMSI